MLIKLLNYHIDTPVNLDFKSKRISLHEILNIEKEKYHEINRDFHDKDLSISFYHPGLIDYLYLAWINEFGIMIAPDLLWYTVLSELQSEITFESNGMPIFILNNREKDWKIDDETLRFLLKYLDEDFQDLIDKTCFANEPENFKEMIGMLIGQYISKTNTIYELGCGYPVIDLQGDQNDWIVLYASIFKLENWIQKYNRPDLYYYLKDVRNVIGNILYYTFNIIRDNVNLIYVNSENFYKNIFKINFNNDDPDMCTNSTESNSDRDPIDDINDNNQNKNENNSDKILIKGWIKKLFFNRGDCLSHYPSHIYKLNYGVNERFVKFSGPFYSCYDSNQNILKLRYGSIYFSKYPIDFQSKNNKNNINNDTNNENNKNNEMTIKNVKFNQNNLYSIENKSVELQNIKN